MGKMTKEEMARKVELTLTQKVKDRFPRPLINGAVRLVGALARQEVIDRTNEKKDVNGAQFRAYSKYYPARKQAYISGKSSKTRGKKSKRTAGGKSSQAKTPYAATKVDDYMRLSGRLFSDIFVTQVRGIDDNGFIGGSFMLGLKTDRSRMIGAYLINIGFDWFGLSSPGSARGRAFNAKAKAALKGYLNLRGGGNLSIFRG